MALTTNLISYYKADEGSGTTGADAHGSNTLTVNSNLWTWSGFINGSFNGTSTTGRNITRAKITGVKTLNFWLYPTKVTGWYIFSETNAAERWAMNWTGASKLAGRVNNNASWVTDNVEFSINTWYMVTLVIDWASTKLYKNASTVPITITWTPDEMWWASTGANMGIMNYIPNNNIPYEWKLDELGLWSVALTASEITQLYNGWVWLAYPLTVASGFIPTIKFL